MNNNSFDRALAETLHQAAAPVSAPPELKNRIDRAIDARQGKENSLMSRHFTLKKILPVAAAVCIAVAVTCSAAGKIAGYRSHSPAGSDYTSYSQLAQVEKELGFSPAVPETFSNGYSFQSMYSVSTDAMDENGNVLEQQPELMVQYAAQDSVANLNVHPVYTSADDSPAPSYTAEYNGVTLSVSLDHYRFVPVGYEPTEEDKANEAAGHYYISYGADQVEDQEFIFVTWEQDGLFYDLFSSDGILTDSDLVTMAQEVIG